jgi:DNA-directed RNA polymerase I, II, and III subunit RPABC1
MNKDQIITSFGTILEMLQDRGINTGIVSKQHLADMLSNDPFKTVIEIIVDKVKIIYYTPPKFKTADIKKLLEEDVEKDNVYDLYILVLSDNPTANNMKALHDIKVQMEIHLVKRLMFNITKHTLVPKHEVIRDKAVIDDIIDSYKLKTRYQLPIILKNDPIAKYYGMKSGDVVKITRVSESAGEYIVYRCCV